MAAPETRLLIGGELVAGDGDGIEVENPFTEQTIATVSAPSDEQLDAAIAAAREASREWARTPAVDRGELLHEVADRLESRADELAETMTLRGRQAADREPRRGQLGGRPASTTTPRSAATRRAA